jgi:hypothetical protein
VFAGPRVDITDKVIKASTRKAASDGRVRLPLGDIAAQLGGD